MSVKSRADILSDISTLLADNTNGDVSLGDFRTVLVNIADSFNNSTTDLGISGAYEFSGATQYYNNQITNYSGNWYIANTTTTVNGSFNASEWDALGNNLYKATIGLTDGEVLALNATPKTIVAAVAGKSIQVVSSTLKVTYATTAYTVNTSPYLITDTATYAQADFPTALAATLSRKSLGQHNTAGISIAAGETQLIDNKALLLTAAGDPLTGDSWIEITVFYLLV